MAQKGRAAAGAFGCDRLGSWDKTGIGQPLVADSIRTLAGAGYSSTAFAVVEVVRHIRWDIVDVAAAVGGAVAVAAGKDSCLRNWRVRWWLVQSTDGATLSGHRWSGSGFVLRAGVRDRAAGVVAPTSRVGESGSVGDVASLTVGLAVTLCRCCCCET